MNTIIGQKKLVSILSTYTLSSMPSTILLLGEKGCGKTTIANKLANNLGIDLVAVDDKTTAEDLIDYAQYPITRLYWIDLTQVTEKGQNKFLKFIEEPSSTMKVVLGAESEVGILPTILNRCLKLTFEAYTEEELKCFSWAPQNADPLVYRFCNTPGKLNELGNSDTFATILQLCENMLKQFPRLRTFDYSDALCVVNKISTKKEENNKYDFNLFLEILAYSAFEKFKTTGDEFSFEVYRYTIEQRQKIINKFINKEAFMLNFINHLWEVAHEPARA